MYQQYQGKPNIILIAFVALCALVVITIFYLILRTSSTSGQGTTLDTSSLVQMVPSPSVSSDNSATLPTPSALPMPSANSGAPIGNQFEVPANGTPQVFHVRNNIFSKADAPAVCKLYGADVATIEQLMDAQTKGADWCSGGWTKEGLVAYPIQQATFDKLQENDPQNRNICGLPGINFLRNDSDLLYGVNCFGAKRKALGVEKIQQSVLSDKDIEIQNKMSQFRQLDINIAPWSSSQWSEY